MIIEKYESKNEQQIKSETIKKILEVCNKVDKTLPLEYQIKQLYDWCTTNFKYNFSARERFVKNDPTLNLKKENNIDKLMSENVGVCGQFTEAFCLMCSQLKGVRSFYIKTDAKSKDKFSNGNHAICLLEIDGKKSFVDVSCGLGAVLKKQNSYDFLLKSWRDLQETYFEKRNIVMKPNAIMVNTTNNINSFYDYFKGMDNEIFADLQDDNMKNIWKNSFSYNIKGNKREIFEDYAK